MISFRQSNPLFNSKTAEAQVATSEVMTRDGAIFKGILAVALTLFSAVFTYAFMLTETNMMTYLVAGGIIGFILSLVTIFSPRRSVVLAPIYAVIEGVFLAALSYRVALVFPGLPFLAVLTTGGLAFVMLILYRFQIIKVTQTFRSVIISAIMGIMLVYLIAWIMSMFGVQAFIYTSSTMSIIFSVLIVGLASMSLLLDFDNIDQWSQMGMPKYMEWYAAFGLLITLVWLYVEVLSLLTKLASRE